MDNRDNDQYHNHHSRKRQNPHRWLDDNNNRGGPGHRHGHHGYNHQQNSDPPRHQPQWKKRKNNRNYEQLQQNDYPKTINPLLDKDLEREDYVFKLIELVHNRRGVYDFLLTNKCTPSWTTSGSDIDHKASVRIKLNTHPSVLSLTKKPYIDLSSEVTATSPGEAGRGKECCKRHAARNAIYELQRLKNEMTNTAKIRLAADVNREINRWARERLSDGKKYERALNDVKDLVEKCDDGLLYGATVRAYGSWTSGVVVGDSDLDVSLLVPGLMSSSTKTPQNHHANRNETENENKDRKEQMEREAKKERERQITHERKVCMLRVLERQAHEEGKDEEKGQRLERIVVVKARVPVLKFHNRRFSLDVDVTIGNDQSVLLSRLFRKHVQEDERVLYLCLLVKQWAKNRMVCGAQHGFINSMGWMIMVIFFLQHVTKPPISGRFQYEAVLNDEYDLNQQPKENISENDKKENEKKEEDIVIVSDNINSSHSGQEDEMMKMNEDDEWARKWALGEVSSWVGRTRSKTPISSLLLQFFKFFAYEFDYERGVISLGLTQRTKMFNFFGRHVNYTLFIEQPLQEKENVVPYVDRERLQLTRVELDRAAVLCECEGILNSVWQEKLSETTPS